jgi:hypothetical protein
LQWIEASAILAPQRAVWCQTNTSTVFWAESLTVLLLYWPTYWKEVTGDPK